MGSTTIYDSSIFKQYFESNDVDLLKWIDNVLTKLQAKGILAEYIEKGDTDDSLSDFNVTYYPIVKFFGYLVRLAREFEDFKDNETLANSYLLNHGHYTCDDEILDQLLFTITNLLRRRARRGTIDTITPATNPDHADGEILDLVCWNDLTFFKLGVPRPQKNSWNINNSSPLYRGCTGRYDLNIGYEYTEDVEDLNLYPILNPLYVTKKEYRYKQCIKIDGTPFGQDAGIGLVDLSKKIIVNPNYNYEISFYIAQSETLENITFAVKCYDFSNTEISMKSMINGSNKDYFFQTRRLNKAGTFYHVRGIVFNKDEPNRSIQNSRLNIGFGEHLRMPSEAVSIIPYIVMDNNKGNDSDSDSDNFSAASIDFFTGADSDSISAASDHYDGTPAIYLWNIKVTPCSTDYERCYLNNKNFIDVIVTNHNGIYNPDQIKDILRRYFIPYNTAFNLVNLPRHISKSNDPNILLLETGDKILFEDEGLVFLEDQP